MPHDYIDIIIRIYPSPEDKDAVEDCREWMHDNNLLDDLHRSDIDLRPPRVVSVKRVGRRKAR